MTYRKKLIEVSLPLEAINKEAAREKSIRHGHPSTLHLWWARRPLAACRAVLFSSLVDDPSEYMPDEESARVERERLFRIIEDLVKWENSNNDEVLDKARLEIARSVARTLNLPAPIGRDAIREFLATKAPPVLDPFAGGGSIPLEAQRLGLRAYASDLNPVAVLINKALIEIPPKFANMPPVHPPEESPSPEGEGLGVMSKKKKSIAQPELWTREWKGAQGLAEDVRYYGKWMRDEAFKRIGHLYPPVTITEEMLAERPDLKEQGLKPGDQLTVIAWLWARAVKCPNPACGAQMPLVTSFALSTKKGSEAFVKPIIENKKVRFIVKKGKEAPPDPPKIGRGAQFQCLVCNQIAPEENLREEFKSKRHTSQLMAIVATNSKSRVYLSPLDAHQQIAFSAKPVWFPEEEMSQDTPNLVSGRGYGITHWKELFTLRQLTALTTLSDLIEDVKRKILDDINNVAMSAPDEYVNSILIYLSIAISKLSDALSSFVRWKPSMDQAIATFGRQALPMVWDYAESNIFNGFAGDYTTTLNNMMKVLDDLPIMPAGNVELKDAQTIIFDKEFLFSTDPPYYDNIAYADLADYFYLWQRISLKKVFPSLYRTVLVPKSQELVATPYRFQNNRKEAENFFENGLKRVFKNIQISSNHLYPVTIYYAFKQAENNEIELETTSEFFRASTGWEKMLASLLSSGFELTGTWPMRTEMSNRNIASGTNALASSIVLVCRPRPENSTSCSRREFLSALKKELAPALRELQQGSIAPVDLAQASIGPGMAVFSRYSAVLEADGSPMSVRTALGLINQALDEYLTEQEGEYDSDTRWALAWFEQFGHNEAPFGVAETLSKAKNTSVNGLVEAGFLEARAGKVRIYRRDELNPEWDPNTDKRPTAWEAVQHLIHALENRGEESAAGLLANLGAIAEPSRDLAYRLYTLCERKGWAQDALGYNSLVVAWPRLKELASRKQEPGQETLFG